MGDDGLRHIVANLIKTCLRMLGLCGLGITDEGIIELAEVLPRTHIICLSLHGNKIGVAGLKSLSRAIINIPFFCLLNITDNPEITTEGIKDFFSSMINHPNLCEVVVYENMPYKPRIILNMLIKKERSEDSRTLLCHQNMVYNYT